MSLISREELLLGAPYKIKDICKVHQLLLGEITNEETGIGLDKYHYYINMLTMEEEDLKEVLQKKKKEASGLIPLDFDLNMSVFQYLMSSAQLDNSFFLDFKTALSTFIKEDILISPKKGIIIVGNPIHRRVITEKEFQEIGMALRLFNKMRVKQLPPENETPLQRKFRLKREERDRVKEKQMAKNEDNLSFADVMSSICVMNVGINLLNIKQYTIYQIKDLLERAQAKEAYHTELDMLMAGADSKKIKPKHYVRNLQKEVNQNG